MLPRPAWQRCPGFEKTAEESRLCHSSLQCHQHHHHHHHQKCPHLRHRHLQKNNKTHRSKHLDRCMQVPNGDASASVVMPTSPRLTSSPPSVVSPPATINSIIHTPLQTFLLTALCIHIQQTQLAIQFQLSSAIAAAGVNMSMLRPSKGCPLLLLYAVAEKAYLSTASTVCVYTAKHRYMRLMLECCYAEAALPSSEYDHRQDHMQQSMCNTGGAGFKHIAAEQSIRGCSAT